MCQNLPTTNPKSLVPYSTQIQVKMHLLDSRACCTSNFTYIVLSGHQNLASSTNLPFSPDSILSCSTVDTYIVVSYTKSPELSDVPFLF